MPFQIVRDDITKMRVDAIVNAANSSLLGGGGVDGAIHRAAGPGLLRECQGLGGCQVGQSKMTGGYKLPCRYVIHTVGPVWQGGGRGEKELLRSCYRSALLLAERRQLESIAFPLISSGAFGFPKTTALETAVDAISSFLLDDSSDMTVYLVIYDRDSYRIGEKLFVGITEYIDDHYVEENEARYPKRRRSELLREMRYAEAGLPEDGEPEDMMALPPCGAAPSEDTPTLRSRSFRKRLTGAPSADTPLPDAATARSRRAAPQAPCSGAPSLEAAVGMIDESFSQMLLRKIDESGMTDAECYHRANIDRRLFSKIRSNPDYRPSRQTVLAFAIALELPMDEVNEMLMKAGFALSRSSKFDIIVTYFIEQGNYDLFEINEALFQFDQVLLGG